MVLSDHQPVLVSRDPLPLCALPIPVPALSTRFVGSTTTIKRDQVEALSGLGVKHVTVPPLFRLRPPSSDHVRLFRPSTWSEATLFVGTKGVAQQPQSVRKI